MSPERSFRQAIMERFFTEPEEAEESQAILRERQRRLVAWSKHDETQALLAWLRDEALRPATNRTDVTLIVAAAMAEAYKKVYDRLTTDIRRAERALSEEH